QFNSRDYIAPLVVTAHLQPAAVLSGQIIEIVCLEQHIVELNEIQAGFEADFIAFGGKHPVHAKVPAYIAQELNVAKVNKPVGIVQEQRLAVPEIQKSRKLLSQGSD